MQTYQLIPIWRLDQVLINTKSEQINKYADLAGEQKKKCGTRERQ